MIVPPRPKDSLSLSIGAILRMMFASGATDDVVTRFVALHAGAMSADASAVIVELGPALQQAATSAGVEVARELLGHIEQVRQEAHALVRPERQGSEGQKKPTLRASKSSAARRGASPGTSEQQIYRFDVASGRTSVSLPADLLRAAKAAFGEADLTKLVQQLYGQALSSKASTANKVANSGPVRKVNKSSLIRDALAKEIALRQVGSPAEVGTFH